MSIYIGNDLEDRLEALETENASLRKYNEYHQVVHEIDHMSDLHVDSSFHKQSMKLDNYVKIEEWLDSSLGETTVIQRLNGITYGKINYRTFSISDEIVKTLCRRPAKRSWSYPKGSSVAQHQYSFILYR